MKSFVAVVAMCFVASTFAVGITEEQRTKLREYKTACITESGVDEAVVEKIKKGEQVVFDDKLNCFSACMLKKVKIMREDGTIDEEVARAKVPQDLPKEKVDEVVNMCKVQVGKDSCETGGKVLGCLMKTKAVTLIQ